MKDFKLLEQTTLLFWDTTSNFKNPSTQLKIGKDLFKDVVLVTNADELKTKMEGFNNEDKFVLLVHLNHSNDISGYRTFNTSKALMYFPNLKYNLVSSIPRTEVYMDLHSNIDVYSYEDFHSKIGNTFPLQTKSQVCLSPATVKYDEEVPVYPQIDYAIITALYEDEFEEVEKLFEWNEGKDNIQTETKIYKIGHFRGDINKKIVAAIPSATGMVDSAIIATQMLEFFKPKYLLMSGVCGGKAGLNFGDIVLASKIFAFQKGKISDLDDNDGNKLQLFDENKMPIDTTKLYDSTHKQVQINIEKFEVEHDTMIELDSLLTDKIKPKLKSISDEINKPYNLSSHGKITIHFEPLACSTMVINKEGYFEQYIKSIDRKTVAVEMESYGVARACKFANNGKTKFVIFKSVMDNMTKKDDTVKKHAAYTSAQFMKHLLYDGIL